MKDQLIARMRELSPWHLDFEVAAGVRTSAGNPPSLGGLDHRGRVLIDPGRLRGIIESLYPKGLAGKSFLDVGCNSGGYCFLANSLGASRTLGFDAREHWIRQAEFVKEHRDGDSETLQFVVGKLADVDLSDGYDLTLFKGIFYHLPDPIGDLLTVCEATREAIIVNSACRNDVPEGALLSRHENTSEVMSGIDGLCWYPGGPKAVLDVLEHAGFRYAKIDFWRKQGRANPAIGRFQLCASRTPMGALADDARFNVRQSRRT